MWHTSIGYHTFTIFRRFNKKDIDRILDACKKYSKDTGSIMIYPTNETKTCYRIENKDKHSGIDYWQIRFTGSFRAVFKEYTVEAKINPKILVGEIDYVRATDESYFSAIVRRFNEEARKISKLLGEFHLYRPNRIDYCLNLGLLELGIPCTPEQMMELIQRSEIPAYYSEYKKYAPRGHRMKSIKNCYYLKSKSVVINCYCKYAHLRYNYPDNPSLEDARSVIRFEIQYKYMKLYTMIQELKRRGIPSYDITRYLFSDEFAKEVIVKYFDRVIMRGDYYTLKDATERIRARKFRDGKEKRMIDALALISQKRGIYSAKEFLRHDGGDLSSFNRAMHELVDENINPVTIPKSFGTKHIPNLLEAYFRMESTGLSALDVAENYFAECGKRKNAKSKAC